MKIKTALKLVLPDVYLVKLQELKKKKREKRNIKREKRLKESEYEEYLEEWYKKRTGAEMDFDNPVTFTQKQQWLKLYDNSEEKTLLSDKYTVRNYVQNLIGKDYLVPLISICNRDHFYDVEEIDFDKLPNQFVLKGNHGSGYNIIVKNKSLLSKKDIKKIKSRMSSWLSENYAYKNGLELVYKDIQPCIIIEKYIAMDDDLPDYKFLCFSGTVKYVWCDQGRYRMHTRTVYDLNYKKAPFNFHDYNNVPDNSKPINFEDMIHVAKKLCGEFPYVRVDLYNVNGKVYFGELTFSSASGGELPNPTTYDRTLGDLIVIDKMKRENNYRYRKTNTN